MAMSIGTSNDGPMIEINTTPLIDVLLVLLIMLIITLPAMTHAIKLDMPIGQADTPPPRPVEVAVDFDNTIVLNGSIVGSIGELERQLSAFSRVVPQPTVNVRADRRSKYDTVAQVLAAAQRNGLRNIAIQGNE